MNFQPTLTLDGLIAFIGIVAVAVGAAIKFGKLEQKVNVMYVWFSETILKGKSGEEKKHRDQTFFGAE